jgi:hypothetical protein
MLTGQEVLRAILDAKSAEEAHDLIVNYTDQLEGLLAPDNEHKVRSDAQSLVCDGNSWEGPDDIQIDDDARVVTAEDGCWVQAWIRVPKEDDHAQST